MKVFRCFLMVAIRRLQLKTGKAFQRQGILLKYEFQVEPKKKLNFITYELCQVVPEKNVTWLLILKLAVGI